ncbi:MAG TPA: myo-inositol-1-phosphate synthase [Methermicoccus shengliensis]|uniref:Myo-inositol-1-phosphate synthase n=2 Tax=Methermicoccus shengliensis TaxID=660064 RepID=A0A832RXB4_9EURY|nr:MAG: Myo-inositol-1-phosphate synthase [Euryarchaeota archaeon 55_53]KUK29622.1 MAG: Myo-inositol-1-phosphate synthase [Methanosarcinales archeaon 56_1174]MDI3487760.1 myo-inositol-phosphate synthase [Methanosarcinales archaeon]MDN5294884.1 myo-inositol-phosphate synthase [Methanosarcinales archaeon]HIH70074.1 myo-inositol-1-phosphate synthase [Methermicoccus shengliensis]
MKMWLVGAYGIVSTTAMLGAKAIENGSLSDTTGLVSELPIFEEVRKCTPLRFEFGGHDIRSLPSAYEATLEHWEHNRHFDGGLLEAAAQDLRKVKAAKGTALNCGSGIKELSHSLKVEKSQGGVSVGLQTLEDEGLTLREIVERLLDDMARFSDRETVVINLASTEPMVGYEPKYHETLDRFETMLDEDVRECVSASMLYAYAALKNGLPYVNFTPSTGSNIPALRQLAEEMGVPHAGNDGKTGETLVKTTLAPMFSYRNLKVLGWMGYNILGDYDGVVLSHSDNKQSKVKSKDAVLEKMLGYPPHTITEIDYFPSLVDNKTAFDFIHFKGFLGTTMKMYFIWDAIDAIVAAPLVIDLARFMLFAKSKGCRGVIKELAFFFKSPMDTRIVNTHAQYEMLKGWYSELAD